MENNNGKEIVVDGKVEETSTKIERGSMGRFVDNLMKDAEKGGIKIIGQKEDGSNGKERPAESAKEKLDYSIFKNIDDEDYKRIDDYLKTTKIENPTIRHKLASDLDDIKKNQRLVSERSRRIEELEKSGIKEVEVDKKYGELINGLKSDFFGTYEKVQKEHKLPDITTIAKQITTGDTLQARVAQYQKDVLAPDIEKRHNLPEGTFVFDATEAWQSGTPSYDFRTKTADKENELRSSWQNKEKEVANSASEMIKIRNEQIKELKDSYFPVTMQDDGSDAYKQEVIEKDKRYTDMLAKLDAVYNSMKEGKALSTSENPFIFKNVFRGLFYDDLSKIDIQRAIQKVHDEYAKYGLRLPRNASFPDDVTRMKGESPDRESVTFKVGDTKFSPQNRFLNRVAKDLNK